MREDQSWAWRSAAALWTFPVTTTCTPVHTGTSIHEAYGAANDSGPQERSWGGYCRNGFQAQPTQGANCNGWIPSNPLWKIFKMSLDKTLSIPNYYRRKDDQNDNTKPNPISQNGHPQKSTNSKCGRGPGANWTPIQGWWEGTLPTTPRKDSLHMPEYKHFKRANCSVWHPHLGLYPQKSIIQKDTCPPIFTVVLLIIIKIQNNTISSDRLKLKDNVINKNIELLVSHEKAALKLWNYATGGYKDGHWRVIH